MHIALLNGGGDCAGLNAVTRGVLADARLHGDRVTGIRNGWAGLLDISAEELTFGQFQDSIGTGGTMLGTSRTNPLKRERGLETIKLHLSELKADVLIAVGGDDTLGVALKLHEMRIPVIGVPKTIDNDLAGTDFSFGFFSAVDSAMELIESLKTTGASHDRVMVVEVMGRDAGWITLFSAVAAGAHMVLLPEKETPLKDVVELVKRRHSEGKKGTVIAVAEGVNFGVRQAERDEFGHELVARAKGESNASYLARLIEQETGMETRATVLGHTIRGGRPNAYDRVMTSMLGVAAVRAARAGRFGVMVAIRGSGVEEVPLSEGVRKKFVDDKVLSLLSPLFG
ncbi:MAG: ATP-dependent 6-phosphofructokinase [Methanomassiliicoccales archaeon]